MDRLDPSFGLEFDFPIYFTRDLFSPENPVFREAVARLEPERRHRILFVIDSNVASEHRGLAERIDRYADAHAGSLERVGEPIVVPGGEESKSSFAHVARVLDRIHALGIDRQSFVAAIGGGAVIDMACFAAAIAHRGIRAVRVPTTVLAQCDSGVGVKNGINWFGKKNFIGTFAPPFAVCNDSLFLESLDERDRIAGLAEAVKVAIIRDPEFFRYLEANVFELADGPALDFAIRRSAELHSAHICSSGDPFELGSARPLDFGHWSAHKLESMTGHRLRHGEAVAIGMALDVLYSAHEGYLSASTAESILRLLENLGLPLWDDALGERDDSGGYTVLQGVAEFREHLGGELHVSMLAAIGRAFDVHAIDAVEMAASIRALRERFGRIAPGGVRAAAGAGARRR